MPEPPIPLDWEDSAPKPFDEFACFNQDAQPESPMPPDPWNLLTETVAWLEERASVLDQIVTARPEDGRAIAKLEAIRIRGRASLIRFQTDYLQRN